MRLGPPTRNGPPPDDVAVAVRQAAHQLGHRPAVTLLLPAGRQEQSAASLAQWAAKGAHLLQTDLFLEPGDEVRLDAPWSWTTAAVALAVWWAGGVVRLGPGGAPVLDVLGPDGPADPDGEVLTVGDGIDGAPTTTAGGPGGLAWTREAQPFPDQPPPPAGAPDAAAVRSGDTTHHQRALLERAAAMGDADGTAGLAVAGTAPDGAVHVDPVDALALVALRPLLTGAPTLIARGVDQQAAAGDRVRCWAVIGR
ncbi:MAG: hypothetical protein JJT89_04285 [Nitriliruptoraceae bacterium]|nr:hypothetical protein [Nitriliruptoraceae bacterium]